MRTFVFRNFESDQFDVMKRLLSNKKDGLSTLDLRALYTEQLYRVLFSTLRLSPLPRRQGRRGEASWMGVYSTTEAVTASATAGSSGRTPTFYL